MSLVELPSNRGKMKLMGLSKTDIWASNKKLQNKTSFQALLTKTCQTFSLAPSKEQKRILTPAKGKIQFATQFIHKLHLPPVDYRANCLPVE